MVEHRSLSNLAVTQIGEFAVGSDSRVLQFVSFSFDVCISEVAMALCSGAALYLASTEALLPGEPLLQTLRQHRITHVSMPMAALSALPHDADLEALQTLIVGGEALPAAVAARWSGKCRLFNAYGPTETTVSAAHHRCNPRDTVTVPIGRPLANVRIYLLDEHLQPVPLGVAGELYIGGAGVARGYLNRPELTAECFIADPFSSEAGDRLYKTGDRGRYLPTGDIEFLSRNDFQVKIRGFRIELGEIEARINACDGVREAVVLAREDVPGAKQLVAYFIADEEQEAEAAALRGVLRETLPDYMVPAAFVRLDTFPLTPNGKLDRRALPAPDASALVTRHYEAPQGPLESALAAIWQDVLKVAQVGRHDQFFELGGHSLLAVQLASRLRTDLSIELPLRALFAHPTLADLASQIGYAAPATLSAILPADRTQALPLSFAQQRLWFLDQLDHAASAAYHMPAGLRLRGQLDIEALQRALDHIVARHESLRTSFASVEGQPVQVFAPSDCGFSLTLHDLRDLHGQEQRAAVERVSADEAAALFNLATGPLIRGRLLKLADDEHVLLLTQHHIISDGWSTSILVRELSALYAAFSQGAQDPLPPLVLQFADYATWQRSWLQGERLQQQGTFWQRHLSGAPALLEMPTDRPRPAKQSYAGNSIPFILPAGLTAGLRTLTQRHGATLFMTLLAGWATLLSRFSGQDDVVIGTSFANRQRSEVEPMIGFLINTLALRVKLENDPTVAELLAQIKANTLDAYAHQDIPFEQVVEIVKPPRSLSHSPVFQSALVMQNTPDEELALPGLTLVETWASRATAQFDLSLSLSETGDTISARLEYATDLFDQSTIERLMQHFEVLLDGMVRDEQLRVSQLPLLTASHRQQVLVDWNDTAIEMPHGHFAHQLFEAHAAAHPEATALVFEDQSLSFGELNRRANGVAHALLALGVCPDDRVALCVKRSLEMVIGLLGVLKAGAAYVPLDPSYPAERLAYMLADSAPVALLAHGSSKDVSTAIAGESQSLPVLLIEDMAPSLENNPACSTLGLKANHLAYVIYTSGSTGRPKGAMIEHAGLLNYLQWALADYASSSPCNAVVSSSFSFDATITSLYLPLISGGKTVLIPDGGELTDLEQMLESDGNLGLVKITPLHLQMLGRRLEGKSLLAHVAIFVVGGEALPVETVALWRRLSPASRIVNEYGPTETVVGCITYDAAFAAVGDKDVPIGRPIANTHIYLLDRHLQPVPLGVTGEIYIGGAGVGRGYLNRAELTSERFLQDSFVSHSGARMYRTGDLARYGQDGNLEYLGRNDFQLKIRGFRIEPGEIEVKLASYPGVRDAVVTASADVTGSKRLIAYFTATSHDEPTPAELRIYLSSVLPDYMVPAAFIRLDALPLTSNGKLDRRALPAPEQSALIAHVYEAPQGEAENIMAAIWQDLLQVQRVGRQDHFFELGGHSLLVVSLIGLLQKQGMQLNVRAVFAAPTLQTMAAIAVRDGNNGTGFIAPPNLIPDSVLYAGDDVVEEFRI
jgi:amino acid adenylation domain-containing protein